MTVTPAPSLDDLVVAAFAGIFHRAPGALIAAVALIALAVISAAVGRTRWRRYRMPRIAIRKTQKKARHAFVRSHAERALSTFHSKRPKEHPAIAFSYLRSLPAFVFEEMILLSLRQRNLKVLHNDSYTNDGGVDGRFWLGEELWLIQAKRYSGAINADDVWYFNSACERENANGIFVHTGKTPPAAIARVRQADRVVLISGDGLISFFMLDGLKLVPGRRANAA